MSSLIVHSLAATQYHITQNGVVSFLQTCIFMSSITVSLTCCAVQSICFLLFNMNACLALISLKICCHVKLNQAAVLNSSCTETGIHQT